MVDLFFSSRLCISSSFSDLLGVDGGSGRSALSGEYGIADVVVRISTSGYRLYSSITTIRYSPVGNGPTKSTATLVQAFSGRVSVVLEVKTFLGLRLDRANTS